MIDVLLFLLLQIYRIEFNFWHVVIFKVRLIDSGNSFACSLDNLRKATMFEKIPAFAHQIKVANIEPETEDRQWAEGVRKHFSESFRAKKCVLNVIGVDELGIAASELKAFDTEDFAFELVKLGLAKWQN